MEPLNTFLGRWEPLWLFVLIAAELLVGLYTGVLLTMEYKYDKEFNEQLRAAKRESRRKKIDLEGSFCDGESK
jgi:hypothetical protein